MCAESRRGTQLDLLERERERERERRHALSLSLTQRETTSTPTCKACNRGVYLHGELTGREPKQREFEREKERERERERENLREREREREMQKARDYRPQAHIRKQILHPSKLTLLAAARSSTQSGQGAWGRGFCMHACERAQRGLGHRWRESFANTKAENTKNVHLHSRTHPSTHPSMHTHIHTHTHNNNNNNNNNNKAPAHRSKRLSFRRDWGHHGRRGPLQQR
jgi:hypothetical protein